MRIRALALATAIVWLAVPSSEAAARVSRVGMLWYGRSLEQRQLVIEPFNHGLGEQGCVEGRNLLLEHRHAGGALDNLPALATELVRAGGDVIGRCSPTSPGPGGNVTGLTVLAAELAGKQMDLVAPAVLLRADAVIE